ncbi:MAG TPA: hypothetical protein VE956_21910 [Nodularia sp. (in: cyanobacteria)]|nr:hypothetical protein [Nodularia sp. (in: cyanobacteria)]
MNAQPQQLSNGQRELLLGAIAPIYQILSGRLADYQYTVVCRRIKAISEAAPRPICFAAALGDRTEKFILWLLVSATNKGAANIPEILDPAEIFLTWQERASGLSPPASQR